MFIHPGLGPKLIIAVNPNVYRNRLENKKGSEENRMHTFGLDAVALRQGKVRSKKFRVIRGRRHENTNSTAKVTDLSEREVEGER